MKHSLTDHPTATIYQYKHVKRIIIRNEFTINYLLSILVLIGFQFLYYDRFGLFAALISFAAIQILHIIITLVTFIQVEEAVDRKWKWSITPPWIGFKPANDISFRVFRRVHNHVFWLGIIIISIMYPWLPTSIMISLFVWHFWLLAPKLFLNVRLRRLYKKTRNGILRIQNGEVNFYQP